MIEHILIVDDEPLMRDFLIKALEKKGFQVTTASTVKEAQKALLQYTFDLILTDMRLPEGSGLDIIRKSKEISPQSLVIVMTAYGTVENAVDAMQLGAFTYFLKPFTLDLLLATIKKAEEHLSLVQENRYLRERALGDGKHSMIAESPVMKQLLAEVTEIAQSNASVFIHGESGTGKEVIAHALHSLSRRANGPYIRVNCAAIPDTLIESEFFGHEKGAFTGAAQKRVGRFELADKGTLLLDEVTEIPIGLQPKLLRVIQEREVERVGGGKPHPIDVRLISTSNRTIEEAIASNYFREDLYYRLNVIPLSIPPLRERKEDILPLAEYYLSKSCRENGKPMKTLSAEAKECLLHYSWPGNIRELTNLMERVVVRPTPSCICPLHLGLK